MQPDGHCLLTRDVPWTRAYASTSCNFLQRACRRDARPGPGRDGAGADGDALGSAGAQRQGGEREKQHQAESDTAGTSRHYEAGSSPNSTVGRCWSDQGLNMRKRRRRQVGRRGFLSVAQALGQSSPAGVSPVMM